MAEKIPQGIAKLVVFRAYLASDGKTPATGKTIAITMSKNGATSFSNPAAGATNATEMASGFYKFTLGTADVDTRGPLAWRGAHADINDAGDVFEVADPYEGGFGGALIGIVDAGSTATEIILKAANGINGGAPSASNDRYRRYYVYGLTGTMAGAEPTYCHKYVGSTRKMHIQPVIVTPADGDVIVLVPRPGIG